jgi:hypothetical protein
MQAVKKQTQRLMCKRQQMARPKPGATVCQEDEMGLIALTSPISGRLTESETGQP